MADKIIQFKQKSTNDKLYPKTLAEAVYNASSETLENVEAGAQVNKIESISINGVTQTISDKNVDLSITTPTEQIQSDWSQSDNTKKDYIKNKPTIPTVNNATLTITQGGVSKGTFTANASSDITIALDAGGSSLPSQTGNAGKLLTTDGTDASWGSVATIYPVIETYINGASWYRVYSADTSGYKWCVQGGCYYGSTNLSGTDVPITFLKTFRNTTYTFIPQVLYNTANATANGCYEKYPERATSSTKVRFMAGWLGYCWVAYGYIVD